MRQLIRNATEAALSIPEILFLITLHVSPRTQAACARVCKKWSEIALDELWRDLEDIYPLLKLVVPIDSFYDKYTEEEFRHEAGDIQILLRDADWPRFRQHATRVRSITYHENAVEVSPPPKEGIGLICLHHPYRTCLTPNVRTLWWTLDFNATIAPMWPFISQCLEDLRLEIYLEPTETQEVFFGLTHRTPTLKRLFIESDASPDDISLSLSRWIRTCLSLEKAHIPRGWQTPSLVTAFGSLPNLFEFGIHWSRTPDVYTGLGVGMEVVDGHFQSLRRLGWLSNIKEAKDLLHQTSCGLQGLTLDCPGHASQSEVVAFIAAAAHQCPDLDIFCLHLANFVDVVEPGEQTHFQVLKLDLEIIRPLLACKGLRVLRIRYPGPYILSTSDLDEMGAAWPNMEQLVLCPDSNDPLDERGTPISRLPHIATAFPHIRILGLYFDKIDPPGPAGDLLPEIQFQCLRELHVGASPVPSGDTAAVGLYLASLFAVGTKPSIKAETSGTRSKYFDGSLASDEWEEIERWVHRTMRVKEAVLCRLSGH